MLKFITINLQSGLNLATVKMLKILTFIFSVFLSSFFATETIESSAAEHFNCSNIPTESQNFTCCRRPEIYSKLTIDKAYRKTLDYEAANAEVFEEYRRSENRKMFKTCIYYKFLLETAGFLVDEKFLIENFKTYLHNISDLANYVDQTVSYFEKCVNLAHELNVKDIQERMVEVKLKDCNYEPQFLIICMESHFNAVRCHVRLF